MKIISIGGGRGYDASAIAKLFKEEGFKNVSIPEIVDPNIWAAYLSYKESVNFIVAYAQVYFAKVFSSRADVTHIFHLGTTLNVVDEETAIEILQMAAERMNENDILSILMVDKSQFEKIFRTGFVQWEDTSNHSGLAKVNFTKTGKHYKTVGLVSFMAVKATKS